MASVHVIKCTTDPISAPTEVGQHWVNTTSGAQFYSNGTTSVANWINYSSVLTALNSGDNVSELVNDAGYLTEATHDALPSDNPHGVTATQVGLGNVDNTSDTDKPVSVAQAAANAVVSAFAIQRSNHTGTQSAASISGLTTVATTGDHGDLVGLADDDHTQYHNDARGDVRYYLKSEVDDLLYSDYVEKIADAAGSVGINNTTTQATYTTLNFTTPASDDYDLDFSWVWSLNNAAQDFRCELFIDGSPIAGIPEQSQEPKDTAGTGTTLSNTTGGTSNSGTNQRHYASMMKRVSLSAGAHTASIRWDCGAAGDLATIYFGNIRVRRAP